MPWQRAAHLHLGELIAGSAPPMSASISRSASSTQTPLAEASDARHGRDLRWRLRRRVSAALALAPTRPQMQPQMQPRPQPPESDQRLWLRAVGLAVVLSLALIGGCSKPQLDTSTAEQFETSVEAVRAKLPMDARAEFDAALLSLTGTLPERRADADARPTDLGQHPAFEALSPSLRAQLQGRTGRQVIAIATKVREEREARELKAAALERERRRRSALNELRGLRAKLDAYNLETLQGLSVIKARLITNEVENELDLVKDWFAINAEDSDGRQATNRPPPEIELEIESQVRNGIYGVLFEIELFKPQLAKRTHRACLSRRSRSDSGRAPSGRGAPRTLAPIPRRAGSVPLERERYPPQAGHRTPGPQRHTRDHHRLSLSRAPQQRRARAAVGRRRPRASVQGGLGPGRDTRAAPSAELVGPLGLCPQGSRGSRAQRRADTPRRQRAERPLRLRFPSPARAATRPARGLDRRARLVSQGDRPDTKKARQAMSGRTAS